MHDTDTPADTSTAVPLPPYDVVAPRRQSVPVVFASPHSGGHYPDDLMAATGLSKLVLRRSADNFVDQIFAAAPDHGAPLLRATYGRAYLDLNREPLELDPVMFNEPLPENANTTSLRVASGLGTIPRLAVDGREIYRHHLDLAEVRRRLHRVYFPYHHTLARMVEDTRLAFGHCLLIDCHSMPSAGAGGIGSGGSNSGSYSGHDSGHDSGFGGSGERRADIVLGDRFGAACAPELTDRADCILSGLGLRVRRNNPYAGGFTTYHYGRPADGVHALQIEINRCLYMDEELVRPRPGMARIRDAMTALIAGLSRLPSTYFSSREAAE